MDESAHIGVIEDYCKEHGLYFDNEGSTNRVRNINIGIQKPCKYENTIKKLNSHILSLNQNIQKCDVHHANQPWTTVSIKAQETRKKLIEEYSNAIGVLEEQE